jgi:hypothetical protein
MSCVRIIERICSNRDVLIRGEIPFDLAVTKAMAAGNPATAAFPKNAVSQTLSSIWVHLQEYLIPEETVQEDRSLMNYGEVIPNSLE